MTLPGSPPPGPPPISATDNVIRPSRAAYLRALRANAIIAVPLLFIIIALQGLRNPIIIPIYLVVVALSLGLVWLYFRTTTVRWGDGFYVYRTIFGITRSFTAADAGIVITLSALQISLTLAAPQFIVLDKTGRKLLRLNGTFWATDDLGPLATDLASRGVPAEAVPQPVTALQVRQRHPGAIRWWEAHRVAFTLIVVGATVLIMFAVVITVIAIAYATS